MYILCADARGDNSAVVGVARWRLTDSEDWLICEWDDGQRVVMRLSGWYGVLTLMLRWSCVSTR